jgi:putative ABC transport system ATP-binding protein
MRLQGVTRTYDMGHVQVDALRGVDISIEPGEFVAIVGPSGSGKSTMMGILGLLDRPTSGTYVLENQPVSELGDNDLARIRNRTIGFVFQSYNLLPRTSAVENVATPLLYQGVGRKERLARAAAALDRLGLGGRLTHEPTELSGGEQQRVAVARALVTNPAVLLADEPTGNLAVHQGREVLELFKSLHAAGRTVVLITHDPGVAANAERQIHLLDGQVVSGPGSTTSAVAPTALIAPAPAQPASAWAP